MKELGGSVLEYHEPRTQTLHHNVNAGSEVSPVRTITIVGDLEVGLTAPAIPVRIDYVDCYSIRNASLNEWGRIL